MKAPARPYEDRIVRDPAIMTGKPVVKGTRIPVEKVLGFLADKPEIKDLFEAYPRLTLEDVQACLALGEELVRKSHHHRAPKRPKEANTAVA